MEISSSSSAPRTYRLEGEGPDRQERLVAPERAEVAAVIDRNQDALLQDDEIKTHLRKIDILRDPNFFKTDVDQIVEDYKTHLQGQVLPQAEAYHTYEQVKDELHRLAAEHPDRAQVMSIGKTAEGRDLWALKISAGVQGDTSQKPGIVFTGNHHAREWMSMEVPLHLAKVLVEGYDSDPEVKRRVDQGEIWVIPMVNPDGYEYSRTTDSWWRKNRDPITDTGCPVGGGRPAGAPAHGGSTAAPVAYGVDLNRNYDDGNPEHAFLYRPPGDTPCNTWDDFGRATSDDPDADTYRGPRGASEPEVRALLDLELGHANIKGVIDHHGYGEMILRPWGYTTQPPQTIAAYDEVGKRMRAAQDKPYRYMSSTDLYPTSGGSNDTHEINGRLGLTIELGRSFQPRPAEFDSLKKNVGAADLAFLDYILEKFPAAPTPPAPPAPAPQPDPEPAP